jgi:rhodanese-related sulfurtransferase
MKLPWWLPFGSVPEISAADLAVAARSGKGGPQLVDVRSPAEFGGGHIAGAVNVPVSHLTSGIEALRLDPKRPVVAICLTAHRSIPAVRLLRERGFDARQLSGGMLAWRAQKLPETRR